MNKSVFIYIAVFGLTLGAFQNCSSGDLPSMSEDNSAAAVDDREPTPVEEIRGYLSAAAVPSSVNQGSATTVTVMMTNLTSVSYLCTPASGSQNLAAGTLTASQASFTVTITQDVTCNFTGTGAGITNGPVTTSVTITSIAPPPPEPPAPAQLWTWQGLAYQTTCNKSGVCDGVEWASCAGTACAAPKIQCYNATPSGQSGHAKGTTQTTQPTGFACYLLRSDQNFVYR